MTKKMVTIKFLLVFMPLLLLIDWSGILDGGEPIEYEKKDAKTQQDVLKQRDFYFKEYDNVTTEIHNRLDYEHQLFVLKFTVAGAVLGVIFIYLFKCHHRTTETAGEEKPDDEAKGTFWDQLMLTPGASVVCWVAVAISAIIDARTYYNTSIIRELGAWALKIESYFTAPGLPGWELHIQTANLFNTEVTPFLLMDRQLLTWLIYIATVMVFVPTISEETSKNRNEIGINLFNYASYALPLVIILFGIAGGHFYYNCPLYLTIYWLTTFVLALLSFAGILYMKKIVQ